MPYKVFLSHSSFDKQLVNRLSLMMNLYGIDVYLAEYDLRPFQFLSDKVTSNINDSDCVIVFLTANGLVSNYVQNEIGIAIGYSKLIIPIVQKGTNPADLAVLQGREYFEYDPYYPDDVLIKTANYVKSLHLKKEEQGKALLAIGGILGILFLLSNNN